MTVVMRQMVYDKYGGRCAYCGKSITIEDMQVDHIVSKHQGGKDEFSNYNPACRRCNHYKRACSLERFRKMIATIHERVMRIYISKVAQDYGILKIEPWDGKFYFERVEESHMKNVKRQPIKLWYTLKGVDTEGKPINPITADENEYFLSNDLNLICADYNGVSEITLLDDCARIYLMYRKHMAPTPKNLEDAKNYIRKNKEDSVDIVPIGKREYVVKHE